MKKIRVSYLFFIVIGIALIALHIFSTAYFRLKLANFYKNNNQPLKAIQVYNKVIRKDSIKNKLAEEIKCSVNLRLGYIYAGLNMDNKSIESYAKGASYFHNNISEIEKYYYGNDFNKDRLLAIGLLEGGEYDAAISEFKRLQQRYLQFDNAAAYIDVANNLKNVNLKNNNKSLFFLLGDCYIHNNIFDEARGFYAYRILNYGFSPMEVLDYLHTHYSKKKELINKVWGSAIYVTLEDFEVPEPQLNNWVNSTTARRTKHYISEEHHRGHHSEFLDIFCNYIEPSPGEYDFWVRNVNIPLCQNDIKLGIRLFIKSRKPFKYNVGFNTNYPSHNASGTRTEFLINESGNGWVEYKIEDIFGKAKGLALVKGWGMDDAVIDRIIIDTKCISNQFFIDDIDLFIMDD
ncbi:MAG: hypothetical protein PHG69_04080 [Candidatus Omnitrophica bacterium]|nr:hypothetical protein [Candidatus Omnitrophota bacterium]